MDVVGYFLALTNIQAIGGRSPDLNDVSVKTADLSTLANYLNNYPGFNVQDFKEDQVSHIGDVGMYLSSNLRKFCLNGEGDAKDEGVILTFTYKTSKDDQKDPNFADHLYLIRKEGLQEDTVRPLLQQLQNYNSDRNRFYIFKTKKYI